MPADACRRIPHPCRLAFFAGLLLQALLLAAPALSAAAGQAPVFAVALAGRADSQEGQASLADCRAMLEMLASQDMQLRTGLAWRLDVAEHVASSAEEAGRMATEALAAKPNLVVCADGHALRAVLLARKRGDPPIFLPEGVPLEETVLDGIPTDRLEALFLHTSTPSANPKLSSIVKTLGLKRLGFLHVGPDNAMLDLLPARAAKAVAEQGCEAVAVAIPEDSYDACLKGMHRLADLKPDIVYLGHLHCMGTDSLGALLQPLFKAGIPAVGTESLGEASAGALLAYYQRAGTMERRNAYRMLRILFSGREDLEKLATPSELAINMETASRLGIHLPLSVLADADFVVWKTLGFPAY